nr:MAG TPA: hypothetical protein [Caudoviricetes sp.]
MTFLLALCYNKSGSQNYTIHSIVLTLEKSVI